MRYFITFLLLIFLAGCSIDNLNSKANLDDKLYILDQNKTKKELKFSNEDDGEFVFDGIKKIKITEFSPKFKLALDEKEPKISKNFEIFHIDENSIDKIEFIAENSGICDDFNRENRVLTKSMKVYSLGEKDIYAIFMQSYVIKEYMVEVFDVTELYDIKNEQKSLQIKNQNQTNLRNIIDTNALNQAEILKLLCAS